MVKIDGLNILSGPQEVKMLGFKASVRDEKRVLWDEWYHLGTNRKAAGSVQSAMFPEPGFDGFYIGAGDLYGRNTGILMKVQ